MCRCTDSLRSSLSSHILIPVALGNAPSKQAHTPLNISKSPRHTAVTAHHATCTAIPLVMPHNSQLPPNKHAKKNVFNYILWLMKLPMSEESEVTEYYNWFLDLTEPLLNVCILRRTENVKSYPAGMASTRTIAAYFFASTALP